MTQYTITLCGAVCTDQDYITQSQWSDAFEVGSAFTPFDIYGVLGFVSRTPIIGSSDVICDTVSYCWGPEAEGEAPSADSIVFPFRWKATLLDGYVKYGRTDGFPSDASIALFPEILIDAISISVCFDNKGLPVFVIGFKDGHGEIRRFIDESQTLAESITITGTTPQLWFNGLLQSDSDYWDVVCYYMVDGVLMERIERDFFAIEYRVVSGLTGWSLKHVDRGSSALPAYQLMEIHGDNGGKEILSVEYIEAVPTGEIIRITEFEEATSTVSIASDMAYSSYSPPVAIDGGTETETTSSTVAVASDMAYTLSLPVTPVSLTETTSATTVIASDMVYSTSSRNASGSDNTRAYISIASDMTYIDPIAPVTLWHTTVPSDLSTDAKRSRACMVMIKAYALKDYTFSNAADGGYASIYYARADQITSGKTWAYVDEAWAEVASSAFWTTTPPTITDIFHQQNRTFTNWTFDSGTKTVSFSAKVTLEDFDPTYHEDLYMVRNLTKSKLLYVNPGALTLYTPTESPTTGLGGTWTGSNLVLEVSLTGNYSAGDVLAVYGNNRRDITQSSSLTTNYAMPISWIKPVVIESSEYASDGVNTAKYTFVVYEARTTTGAWFTSSGKSFMYLDDFVSEVSLP